MEWVSILESAIEHIETHIYEDINEEKVGRQLNISPYYLSKAFHLLTGYTIAKYIRNRRLYLAALDIIDGSKSLIDIAYDYGYDTLESFLKAYYRFHGVTAKETRKNYYKIRVFSRITISVSINGGNCELAPKIEQLPAFVIYGVSRRIDMDKAYDEIPKFSDEICQRYSYLFDGLSPTLYGVCYDVGCDSDSILYYFGVGECNIELPSEVERIIIPEKTWAKFICIGPSPATLHSINSKIFCQWLPKNKEYALDGNFNVELHHSGQNNDNDHYSEIWIPIRKLSP